MYFFKRILRWWRWTAILLTVLSVPVSAVVVSQRASNGYVCLKGTDPQYTTRIIDTNTGKIFTSKLFPLRSYQSLIASWTSPDKSKVAFYWISGNYVRLLTTLDLRTGQKQSMTFNVTDNQILFNGWSADSKYLALMESRDNGAEILTVFDTSTMQRVLSKAATAAIWSSQGHQIAYLDFYASNLNSVVVASFDDNSEQSFSILDRAADDQTRLADASLMWSPNNRYIALSKNSQIWVYDVSKAVLQKVIDDSASHKVTLTRMIQWSGDSRTLLYIASTNTGSEHHLMAFDLPNGHSRTLIEDITQVLAFLPDLEHLLVSSPGISGQVNYSFVSIETGEKTLLTTSGEWAGLSNVGKSSDGQTLLIMSQNGLLWTKHDGSEHHIVTGLAKFLPTYWDDTWMAYTSTHSNSNFAGLINLQTGDNHTFKESYSALFNVYPAPDGRTVALIFAQQPGKHYVRVKLISADDKWSTTFETNSGDMGRLLWSPDGSKLALYTYIVKGPTALHLLRADGTEIQHFDNLPGNFYLDTWTNCG